MSAVKYSPAQTHSTQLPFSFTYHATKSRSAHRVQSSHLVRQTSYISDPTHFSQLNTINLILTGSLLRHAVVDARIATHRMRIDDANREFRRIISARLVRRWRPRMLRPVKPQHVLRPHQAAGFFACVNRGAGHSDSWLQLYKNSLHAVLVVATCSRA